MTFDEGQGYVVLATLGGAAAGGVHAPASCRATRRCRSATSPPSPPRSCSRLSIYIFAAYQVDGGSDIQMQLRWTWVENIAFLGKDGISLYLGVDGISATIACSPASSPSPALSSAGSSTTAHKDFFILFFMLVAGVYGTFFSLDLFFWFFFYELAVMPLYLLIGVWGSTRKEYGALKLTLMLVGGSVLIWIGIFATFHEAGLGTFDLPTTLGGRTRRDARARPSRRLSSRFMVIGCGVLAALWPFHTWSPDGHMSAPTAVSMVHAGVLMKLGAFGIIRLGIQMMPDGRGLLDAGAHGPGRHRRRLRRDRGAHAARLQAHLRLQLGLATWATCSWDWRP